MIEPHGSSYPQEGTAGRRLNPSAAERPLSIDGGDVSITRAVLRGHALGAINARAASLLLVQSRLEGNHAPAGGAILVNAGSMVRLERCNVTNNAADTNGGALQVRTRANRTNRRQMVASMYYSHNHL